MKSRAIRWFWLATTTAQVLVIGLLAVGIVGAQRRAQPTGTTGTNARDSMVADNARRMLDEGRRVFRFETFGDEAYWGDTLRLHRAIAGEKLGGVGPGVSPKTALSVGLKVDVDAVPAPVADALNRAVKK